MLAVNGSPKPMKEAHKGGGTRHVRDWRSWRINLLRLPRFMMTSSNGNIFRVTGPFFDLRLNKRLSKQPWGWWFETPSWSLWRHCNVRWRYNAMASQITSVPIVCSIVCSGADQREHQKLRVTGLCEGESTGDQWIPLKRASNTENVSIWWRHHDKQSCWRYEKTHLCDGDIVTARLKTMSSKSFTWVKTFVFWYKFEWNIFVGLQLTTGQHWLR